MNKYEFNIEDINSVIAIDINSSCNYKTEYTRNISKRDDGYPSEHFFIETCYSDPIIEGNNVKVVCKRCGTWNSYSLKEYNSDEFNIDHCTKCGSNYENIYSEEEIIAMIISFMNKEIFNSTKLIINGIEII